MHKYYLPFLLIIALLTPCTISFAQLSGDYIFVPITKKGIVLQDCICYDHPTRENNYIELKADSIQSVIGMNESRSIYIVAYDQKQYYVSSNNLGIIYDDILGISTSVAVKNDSVPSAFIADDETCNIKLFYGLYRLLPDYISNTILQDGWTFVVTNKDLKEMYDLDVPSAAAVTAPAEKKVYISNSDASIKFGIYHEIGHVIDTYLYYPSKTAEFEEIYKREASSLHPVGVFLEGYYSTNVKEYFATIVQNIILTGNEYESTAPDSYEYVRRYLCQMKKSAQ